MLLVSCCPVSVYVLCQTLGPVQCVCSGILVGTGMQKIAALCNLVSYYVIGLPVGIALMFAAQLRILGNLFKYFTWLNPKINFGSKELLSQLVSGLDLGFIETMQKDAIC